MSHLYNGITDVVVDQPLWSFVMSLQLICVIIGWEKWRYRYVIGWVYTPADHITPFAESIMIKIGRNV
jgi:hypothetical protein